MEKYKYLIAPIFALILGQIVKFIIESLKYKKLKWERLFNGSGGMPSTHTTLSCTLLFMILFNEGLDSVYFSLSLVLSLIVGYDAMNVRRESGRQAKAINKMIKEVNKDNEYKKLKEQLGHKPKEVLVGVILGLIVSIIYTFIIL